MSRRLFWLLPLLAAAACTGLYLDKGNAYPCDFSQGPGVRDEVCQPGDICGTNNLCQSFIYEGPRFEGKATVPEYGTESGEGAVLHPLALNSAAIGVLADLPLSRGPTGYFRPDGGLFVVRSGHVGATSPTLPSQFPPQFGIPRVTQPFFSGPGPFPNVLVQSDTGKLAVGVVGQAMTDSVRVSLMTPFASTGFRVIDLPPMPVQQAIPVAWNANELGVVQKVGPAWQFDAWVSDAGTVLDVAGVTVPTRLWVFVLLPDAIEVVEPRDGGVNVAAVLDTLTVDAGWMRTDPDTRVVAAVRRGSLPPVGPTLDVLSTFQVNITADGPALTSPWPDCTPCGATQRIELLAPSVRTGTPVVELVCMPELGPVDIGLPKPLRVVGSVALTQFDACLTEEIELPVSISRVAGLPSHIVSWNNQSGVLVGGKHGELWSGETLTSLKPEFLDRVPLDIAPANLGTTPSLAVIADDYLAIQQTAEGLGMNEQLNGFRRVPPRELGSGSSLLGFVHGVGGWAIASNGELARVRLVMGNAHLETGPQLVTASGDPIRSSIGGEAYTEADGGPVGFFVAADDSLYFLQDPEFLLSPANDGEVVAPALTPEPSVPIRSLALERTPLGTNGKDRAAGYLVTSRSVYSWELGGDPARWSSTPILLSAGEPVEVWFDSPRSALGRVGYRDGQIFSLPGGYPLAAALPASTDGGLPPSVIDFENLGGWPVAYATTGLYIAGWDQLDGKLQNRFPNGVNRPMTWREVKVPGADPTPWMKQLGPRRNAKPGKLFVVVDPKIADDGGNSGPGTQLHRLLIFNDDDVRQVARHLRKLSDVK